MMNWRGKDRQKLGYTVSRRKTSNSRWWVFVLGSSDQGGHFTCGGALLLHAALDVKPEGDWTQSLSQLLPQQDLFQLGGRSVLLERGKDRFRVSLVGRGRRLLRASQRDRSPRLWTVDGVGGRR